MVLIVLIDLKFSIDFTVLIVLMVSKVPRISIPLIVSMDSIGSPLTEVV